MEVVLTGTSDSNLPTALSSLFTPAAAWAFLVFTLLYTPCVAEVNAVRREMNSVKSAAGVVLFQTGIAWIAAFAVYRIAALFF